MIIVYLFISIIQKFHALHCAGFGEKRDWKTVSNFLPKHHRTATPNMEQHGWFVVN